MLRIHFTAEDIARTTIAAGADPFWEILLSNFKLHSKHQPAFARHWAGRVRRNPQWHSHIRPAVRLLGGLAPIGPYFPDFLTPDAGRSGLDEGFEAIMSTPRRRLVRELDLLSAHGRSTAPSKLRPLITESATALGHVVTRLRDYHSAAISPYDDIVKAAVDADLAQRVRDLTSGGVEAMLNGLRPLMRWEPPVLLVRYDVSHDLHLHGRGLRLVPSFFCEDSPVSLADPELPPVLIYPIAAEHRWPHATEGRHRSALRDLLGDNRANLLDSIGDGAGTTELARVLGISPAAASRHAAVLRAADLIATNRHGPAVLHTLTPLGHRLLHHNGLDGPGGSTARW
ncbi:winged helix-turn-helix domain-containing protein [Actinosynnema sp. NPDC050801]|uniref:ArsR/SmtB family transcription factor n=1 Tax=unclassified Actinosynnema TaxID=2637065 RepID=UPI0033EF259F